MSVIDRFSEVLHQAVEASIHKLHALGVDDFPRYSLDVEWGETYPDYPTSASIKRESLSLPAIEETVLTYQHALDEVGEIAQMNDLLRSRNGWFPVGVPGNIVPRILTYYFMLVDSLKLDSSAVVDTSSALCSDLHSPNYVARSVFVLQGFQAHRPFDLDKGIAIRPISRDDIDEYTKLTRYHPIREMLLRNTDWVCVAEAEGAKDSFDAINSVHAVWDSLIVALTLGSAGKGRAWQVGHGYSSPFFGGAMGWSSRSKSFGFDSDNELGLLDSAIDDITGLFNSVRQALGDDNLKHQRQVVGRVLDAVSRDKGTDTIVDLVIALESVLASDTDRLEATYRFKNRGAAILGTGFSESKYRIKLMGDLYDKRSRIVHGSSISDLDAVLSDASAVVRRVVGWYLDKQRSAIKPQNLGSLIDRAMVDAFNPDSIKA